MAAAAPAYNAAIRLPIVGIIGPLAPWVSKMDSLPLARSLAQSLTDSLIGATAPKFTADCEAE